jgi:general secretion pathway protein K
MKHDVHERGWALVSVLCVVSMLALLAAATQELTITSSRAERATEDATSIDAAFDAGLARALVGVGDQRPELRWRVDGTPQRFAFNGAVMTITVQDEGGRIDLNAADQSMITRLLQSAGLDLDAAEALTDKILDWRSSTDLVRLHGASDEEYASKGYPWHPRHGPFQRIDELKLVMGMTPALFARIRPALTVYSKRPAIDPEVAPKEALRAYFLESPSKVDDILKQRAEAVARGAATDIVSPDTTQYGQTYDVSIDLLRYGRHRHREIVAMLTGDDKHPDIVLAYR